MKEKEIQAIIDINDILYGIGTYGLFISFFKNCFGMRYGY